MRTLVKISLLLAFCVIVLGAYTRLTEAGWGVLTGGCYGFVLTEHHVAGTNAFP